jgi:hypothetical protein
MSVFAGFVGQSYAADSLLADAQAAVNWYVEGIQSGEGQNAAGFLRETPGIALNVTLPTSPLRGLWANATRLFAVAGADLYEVFSDGTFTNRSTAFGTLLLANDGLPVQIFPNGNQLLIVSAGLAYCDSGAGPIECTIGTPFTGTVMIYAIAGHNSRVGWISGDPFTAAMAGATITIGGTGYTVATYNSPTSLTLTTGPGGTTDPVAYSLTPALAAGTGTFLDGYFIVSQPGTPIFNFSAINDGTTWDALDYATKAGYPDDIAAVFADHEELWLLGTDTTEVWQDTGAALNPLSRISGAFIHHGCCAPASVVRVLNGVGFLSSDPVRGGVTAYLCQGFVPQRISTHAIETAWASYTTCADAVSYAYTEQGHEFWVINFPTGNATWVFDATEGAWHQRAWWNASTSNNDRQRQMFHAFVFGAHYVGDWANGNIYIQSQGTFTDNSVQIVRQRAAPHLNTEHLWSFYNSFELLADAYSASVTFTLDWSDDGGNTWHAGLATVPNGVAGQALRVIWRRLGRSRDRIFRVTVTAASKVAIISAFLDVST